MHQQLALVERTQVRRQRIAQVDGADERVAGGIGDGDGVRELLGGKDAVAMAYRYVGIARGRRSLSGAGTVRARKSRRSQQRRQQQAGFHLKSPSSPATVRSPWPAGNGWPSTRCIAAISCSWVTMISWAMRLSCSLRP